MTNPERCESLFRRPGFLVTRMIPAALAVLVTATTLCVTAPGETIIEPTEQRSVAPTAYPCTAGATKFQLPTKKKKKADTILPSLRACSRMQSAHFEPKKHETRLSGVVPNHFFLSSRREHREILITCTSGGHPTSCGVPLSYFLSGETPRPLPARGLKEAHRGCTTRIPPMPSTYLELPPQPLYSYAKHTKQKTKKQSTLKPTQERR